MNMNKILFSFILALGMAGSVMAVDNESALVGSGWYFTRIANSSGSVFTGSGYVDSIQLSSGPLGAIPDNILLIDTAATTSVPSDVTTTNTSQQFTPQLIFNTTGTINGSNMTGGVGLDRVVPLGIRVNNGCYFVKSQANSGGAVTAILRWRRK